MARKKSTTPKEKKAPAMEGYIMGAGEVQQQYITDTLRENYMPYIMSVIVSRAIPEIDGFKPSHRKLLYTMYKMGLLTGPRTKSANIVGQTMKLNPHGDAAIYETMVRLSKGNEALLHPFVDSKGNFGKAYSKNMMYAASRYTEAKLDDICKELFKDIDKDTVDFVDNYDNKMKEPTLLPATFPTILVNANMGIAVGMASSICPFNLREVCEATAGLIKDPDFDVKSVMMAPDFPGGGTLLYSKEDIDKIYTTGKGSLKIRGNYYYDKANNCIDIKQIPPTATVEAIIDKTIDLAKQGKIKEITDIRDETGLEGLKITIDLKRGIDPDKFMQKMYKMTPLEDSFACNFNILIAGAPRVMGVKTILNEWIAFRTECIKRRTFFTLSKKKDKMHLLDGLEKILLDIDKAIKIVRETEEEVEVVPNLMIGFGIDEAQAEYVSEIKLRHLNREYIINRTSELESLHNEISDLQDILDHKGRIKKIIVDELKEVADKYGMERKTEIVTDYEVASEVEEEKPNYPVNLFFTREGYFKKITPQSLRMSNNQKLKDGDEIKFQMEANNNDDVLFFTNKCQVYKSKISEFDDQKASVLGDFVGAKLGMDEGEMPVYMVVTNDYKGYMLFFYENGKASKVALSSYETKTNRKKLIGAYSDKSPLVDMFFVTEDREFIVKSTDTRMLIVHSGAISLKTTRATIGVAVITLKKNKKVDTVTFFNEGDINNAHRYRVKNLPGAGALPRTEDIVEQLKL